VLAWTVNDKQTAINLYQNGVDAMISDHPERMPSSQKLLHRSAPHAILFKPNEDDSTPSLEKPNQYGLSMQ
jgi:hypothetical protein